MPRRRIGYLWIGVLSIVVLVYRMCMQSEERVVVSFEGPFSKEELILSAGCVTSTIYPTRVTCLAPDAPESILSCRFDVNGTRKDADFAFCTCEPAHTRALPGWRAITRRRIPRMCISNESHRNHPNTLSHVQKLYQISIGLREGEFSRVTTNVPYNASVLMVPPGPKRTDVLVAGFVSNCGGDRKTIMQALNDAMPLHMYGACLHNKEEEEEEEEGDTLSVPHPYWPMMLSPEREQQIWRKIRTCSAYHFCLAMENTNESRYVTEKIFDVLRAGSVPIFFGTPDVRHLVPEGSYIDASSFSSMKALASFLHEVASNHDRYAAYFKWQDSGIPEHVHVAAQRSLHNLYCTMCEEAWKYTRRLHSSFLCVMAESEEEWWNPHVKILPNGLAVRVLSEQEARFLYHEVFEEDVYFKHGITLPSDAPCVVDVGANIGLFTLYVLQRYPSARIVALEPLPPCFAALYLNVHEHNLTADLVNMGVSDIPRTATFTYFPHAPGNSTLYPMERRLLQSRAMGPRALADATTFGCPMTRLSEIFKDHHVDHIDLLKVDVEGEELPVLRGIDDADWPRIRQVVMEVHSLGNRLLDVLVLLRNRGFVALAERFPHNVKCNWNVYATRPQE